MKTSGIIFDFDGTLFDSMPLWRILGEIYLNERGIPAGARENSIFKAMSVYDFAVWCIENYGFTETADEIVSEINGRVERFYRDEVVPKPGVEAFLELAESRGIKMCIVSATDEYLLSYALKRTNLDRYFIHIFTSTAVGSGKNKPRIFELARETLGTDKSETIVFDDALYALKTAKDAGFTVVGVYDESEDCPDGVKETASLFITGFDDIRSDFFRS